MNAQDKRKSKVKYNQTLEDAFDASDDRKEFLSVEEPITDFDAGGEQQQDISLIDDFVSNSAISDLQLPENITDLFYTDNQTPFKKNIRVATRFIREDITCSISVSGLLGLGKAISVDLLDIASKGVLISTNQQIGINKKITLTLQFKSGKVFVIKAKVVRYSRSLRHEYGIKFDCFNNELGDYLFETQEKLIFK